MASTSNKEKVGTTEKRRVGRLAGVKSKKGSKIGKMMTKKARSRVSIFSCPGEIAPLMLFCFSVVPLIHREDVESGAWRADEADEGGCQRVGLDGA